MRSLPDSLKVVALDIKTRVIASDNASENTLALALGKAHRTELTHAGVKCDKSTPELLQNCSGVLGTTSNVVALVIRIDDAELRFAVCAVELSVGSSLYCVSNL